MSTGNRRFVVSGAVLALAALLSLAHAAKGDDVEYTFGRPVQYAEHTYAWYRKTHADEAAQGTFFWSASRLRLPERASPSKRHGDAREVRPRYFRFQSRSGSVSPD